MFSSILTIIYLIASVTFIVGLKMLSHPETARKGNLIAAGGNSVSNLSKAMPQLTGATTIYSYLDNDEAGQKATQKMKDAGLNVLDKSAIYEGYKDFNEYLNK